MQSQSFFQCLRGCERYPLSQAVYQCGHCGGLLEVYHSSIETSQDAAAWRQLFESRSGIAPGALGSGVWRYHEFVLPHLPVSSIVTLGEGNGALVEARGLSEAWQLRVLVKQCGHSPTGSFKDLGMTVLVSQLNDARLRGAPYEAVVCASTGDTSAALAAYAAAAHIPAIVLLPAGKISHAQAIQPLAHGACVIEIETDFDGCMGIVQQLAQDNTLYLANSKNSLRIEGQKTVAFEIAQGLGWQVPDWVVIPGGNLGNVSALVAGFQMLHRAGLIAHVPRVMCAQVEAANPFYRAYERGFDVLEPMQAQATAASAIRIGNPVSYEKARRALQQCQGVVASVSEQALADVAVQANHGGFYVCPHTAVALAAVAQQPACGVIGEGSTVVVVSTAHGLKFNEFQLSLVENRLEQVQLTGKNLPKRVSCDLTAVRRAISEAVAI